MKTFSKNSLVALVVLLIPGMMLGQDCPPHGCSCPDYNDTYTKYYYPSKSLPTQHILGNHTLTGELDGACSFVDGPKQGDGQYACTSEASVTTTALSLTETGTTSPTIVGGASPSIHYHVQSNVNGDSGPALGETSTAGSLAAGVTECYLYDGACNGGYLTWISTNVIYSQNSTSTETLGTYGHTLTNPPMQASLTQDCPALEAPAPSPIVIPLYGGDYSDAFTNFDAGETVTFDFAGRGHPLIMSWIQKDAPYGFLVLFRDKKGNPDPNKQANGGKIDSSHEMFGNLTQQPNFPKPPKGQYYHPNGFVALTEFDNCDPGFRKGGKCVGVLDKRADVWSQLRVWVDTCFCADSRLGRLYTLDELGITELKLKYVEEKRQDRYGNKLSFKGAMVQKGETVPIYDVYFRARSAE